jgi:hypothetical protein
MPDELNEIRLRNAILEHQQSCPQVPRIEEHGVRLRTLNGVVGTVAHHETTLYDEERGLVLRTTWLEENVETMKPKVDAMDRMHLKIGGAVAVVLAVFSILGWIGIERFLRAFTAMAAVPK